MTKFNNTLPTYPIHHNCDESWSTRFCV